MGTQVTHGADTARLRQIAEGLSMSAQRVLEVEQEGATSMRALVESWAGPDTEVFAADWQSAGPQLVAAAELLSVQATQLIEQAEQQDEGSDGSGRGGGPQPSTPGHRTGDPMKDLAGLVPGLFDVKNGDGRYWPDMTAAAGPRFGPQDPAWRYLFDRGTDWANDLYVDHRGTPWVGGAPLIERGLMESSDWLRDVKDEYLKKKTNPLPFDGPSILLDVVADTLEDYGKILHDPKGWWNNDATTWDKVSLGISLVPYLGVLGKVAVKTTKEAFDVVAKGLKHADDVKTPHVPKKSTVDPGSGPDAHDTGNPNKGVEPDDLGAKSGHDSPDPGSDAHDNGNPNQSQGGDSDGTSHGTPDASRGGSIKDLEDAVNHPDPDDAFGADKKVISEKALNILEANDVTDLDRVWDDVMPMPRGFVLEATEGGNLPQSFPVIDRVETTADGLDVASIKSLDPEGVSYNKGNKFENTVNDYVDKLAKFDGDDHGGVAISGRDINERTLDLIVRPDSLTDKQTAALDRAIQRAEEKNVKLVVKERP